MGLIELVLFLIIVGVLLWAMNTYLLIDGKIKMVINIVICLVVGIFVLRELGIFQWDIPANQLGRP